MQEISTLFLQSEMQDPYAFYETMMADQRVYKDHAANLWAIYSYHDCKTVLDSSFTHIPVINAGNKDGLNEYALLIDGKLARLNNGAAHEAARLSASLLFENIKHVSIKNILDKLLPGQQAYTETDWVNTVCNKLPALLLLNGFGFTGPDTEFISSQAGYLSKLITPTRTSEQVSSINSISKEVYARIETHLTGNVFFIKIIATLAEKYGMSTEEALSLCVCNLTGLLIQGYDAGRGLLSNALLQILRCNQPAEYFTKEYLQSAVVETLRFDPPVHNTRRIATEDFQLGDMQIRKNETILVVLAAANRDPSQFINPSVFDPYRSNNSLHLAFGTGIHRCLANHYSVTMAVETLAWLFEKYKKIILVETNISYEPLINARLPKNIFISFHT